MNKIYAKCYCSSLSRTSRFGLIRLTRRINAYGFSLAEMLVVISILAIIGVIYTEVFVRSLKGSYKVQFINKIKQEGQFVQSTLDKKIREADKLIACDKENNNAGEYDAILIVKSNEYSRYYFQTETTTNGYIQVEVIRPADEDLATRTLSYICQNLAAADAGPVYLTDNNAITGVSVKSFEISKSTQAGFKDVVTINFELGTGINAPDKIAGQVDPIPFGTTIGLR